MTTPASPSYRDRALLRVACWAARRLRARGPLPVPFLEAAGLIDVTADGDRWFERTAGFKVLLHAAPRRWAAWRPSTYWSRDPAPARRSQWYRVP